MPTELSAVIDEAVKMVNLIKSHTMNFHPFSILRNEMGGHFQQLLLLSNGCHGIRCSSAFVICAKFFSSFYVLVCSLFMFSQGDWLSHPLKIPVLTLLLNAKPISGMAQLGATPFPPPTHVNPKKIVARCLQKQFVTLIMTLNIMKDWIFILYVLENIRNPRYDRKEEGKRADTIKALQTMLWMYQYPAHWATDILLIYILTYTNLPMNEN